ncbi:acylphosphatase [Patescibacteria group bacterium]
MNQIHLIISGGVCGVGYRSWALKLANSLEITGWVKNTNDGTVELVAQGDKEILRKFVKLCWKGPFISDVKEINQINHTINKDYSEFSVVY